MPHTRLGLGSLYIVWAGRGRPLLAERAAACVVLLHAVPFCCSAAKARTRAVLAACTAQVMCFICCLQQQRCCVCCVYMRHWRRRRTFVAVLNRCFLVSNAARGPVAAGVAATVLWRGCPGRHWAQAAACGAACCCCREHHCYLHAVSVITGKGCIATADGGCHHSMRATATTTGTARAPRWQQLKVPLGFLWSRLTVDLL